MVHDQLKTEIIAFTKASQILNIDVIQELWSGYGAILRIHLSNAFVPSIIVKKIQRPSKVNHPRGWNSSASDQRKWRSYAVETSWYEDFSAIYRDTARIPEHYFSQTVDQTKYLVLEDLNGSGFPERYEGSDWCVVESCLQWLANFHALGITRTSEKLWDRGTYWHLATRSDEFNVMPTGPLKNKAEIIDETLNNCRYQTIVHGDAKLANFCFSKNLNQVAAVDFQYVGKGCGIKDVMYLMSSSFGSEDLFEYEERCLDTYFNALKSALGGTKFELEELEEEWRHMYAFAWADFVRFLEGWSPGHTKLSPYSQLKVKESLTRLN